MTTLTRPVADGSTGILVPPGDDAALAAALTKLLDDAATRRTMGLAGREHVRQFDAPLVAQKFLDAINFHDESVTY